MQLQELKRLYPNLKILVSFGGWGQSEGFTSAAAPDHLRDLCVGNANLYRRPLSPTRY